MKSPEKLIVLDIDNTVFNWIEYYTASFEAMLSTVSRLTGLPLEPLFGEARNVFEREGSIEYPFLIQELPSVVAFYGSDVSRILREAVEPGRRAFNEMAATHLVPYPGVVETLATLRREQSALPIVALTDAPRYVAMWKLNKLGLLRFFDAVYGLPDPRIPIDPTSQTVKVDPEILVKHLQKSNFDFAGRIRVLPDDYEKPGVRGLKTVLMDYEMEARMGDVLWVGDNLRKDVGLGRRLGVHTGWARYGTLISAPARELLLKFSPLTNVAKNAALDPQHEESPRADFELDSFAALLTAVEEVLGVKVG